MENYKIFNEESLTEEEEDSIDIKYHNLYKFISTESNKNPRLKNYIFELGWSEKSYTDLLDVDMIENMYNLLDEESKQKMKNYLREIRKITGNPNFNFVGGKRERRSRKRGKRNKSKKRQKQRRNKSKKRQRKYI
jgi:hypothetical protein